MMRLLLGVALIGAMPATALAYIGPGAGITAIGTVLALVGAVVVAIVGFVWYPIKHLVKRLRKGRRNTGEDQVEQGTELR